MTDTRSARENGRILLVEDDARTRTLIEASLAEAGYEVIAVSRAAGARAALRDPIPAAVVLDLGLPDADGLLLCREWRREGLGVPVLVLTARTDVASRVEGLDAGADDYLGKPFAVAELRARLRALIRRAADGPRERVFRRDGLVVDFARRRALRQGAEVPVTKRELDVLERLVRAKGHAVSREDLLEEIWGVSRAETGASLEVIVARLRRKLDAPGGEGLIRTIRGHGYALAMRSREEGA